VKGVELENGHIKVDEYQNTTASGIYALGDVAGKALLTPGTFYTFLANLHLTCFIVLIAVEFVE